MYRAAVANRRIDVLIVNRVNEIPEYLKNVNTQYDNILFADHASGYQGSGQVIGNFTYRESDLIRYNTSFEAISKNLKKDGKVVLLGCFCAAPQTNGTNYIRSFSALVNRNVIADQGETRLASNLFSWSPLGIRPKPVAPGQIPPVYQQIAEENAGRWSEATPDGNVKLDIGNVRLDANGAPHTKPYTPPLKPENKPLPTWQEIMEN